MTGILEQKIFDILSREIRLVACDNGEPCEKCGEMLDYTWRVTPGRLEKCAAEISKLVF